MERARVVQRQPLYLAVLPRRNSLSGFLKEVIVTSGMTALAAKLSEAANPTTGAISGANFAIFSNLADKILPSHPDRFDDTSSLGEATMRLLKATILASLKFGMVVAANWAVFQGLGQAGSQAPIPFKTSATLAAAYLGTTMVVGMISTASANHGSFFAKDIGKMANSSTKRIFDLI